MGIRRATPAAPAATLPANEERTSFSQCLPHLTARCKHFNHFTRFHCVQILVGSGAADPVAILRLSFRTPADDKFPLRPAGAFSLARRKTDRRTWPAPAPTGFFAGAGFLLRRRVGRPPVFWWLAV